MGLNQQQTVEQHRHLLSRCRGAVTVRAEVRTREPVAEQLQGDDLQRWQASLQKVRLPRSPARVLCGLVLQSA